MLQRAHRDDERQPENAREDDAEQVENGREIDASDPEKYRGGGLIVAYRETSNFVDQLYDDFLAKKGDKRENYAMKKVLEKNYAYEVSIRF